MPVLSVLIPSFNDKRILRALNALNDRDSSKVQIVIQDAGSDKDFQESAKFLLNDDIDKFCIEKDDGIFDGINKGISNCDGEYILTIGSDDICPLETVNAFLELENSLDLYFCNVKMFDAYGHIRRYWFAKRFHRWMYRLGAQYPHFGMIVKKSIYLELGGFNSTNKINADYEFFDLLTKQKNLTTYIDKKNVIYMQLGGTSTESASKIISHQKLMLKYIFNNSLDLIFAPLLKWNFKIIEIIIARYNSEKIDI